MSIMQMLMVSSAVSPGSQTFTSGGTFVVPAYNTLTVTCDGGQGATGSAGANYNDPESGFTYFGGAGGPGGLGGEAIRAYTPAGGGPSVAASITISISGGGAAFGFGTNPTGNQGGTGGTGGDGTFLDPESGTGGPGATGSPGSSGSATGGTTNTTGGSPYTSPRVTITWS